MRVIVLATIFMIVSTAVSAAETHAISSWGNRSELLTAIFTGILTVVTAALAIYTGRLFAATRRLVKETMTAEGPFLLPSDEIVFGEHFFSAELPPGERPRIIYGFMNQGKSPAIIRRWRDYSIFTDRLPATPHFEEEWTRRKEVYTPVAAGRSGGLLYASIPTGMTREQVLQNIGRNNQWLYILGEVEYEDTFNVIRVQGYCLRIVEIRRNQEGIGYPDTVRFIRDGGRAYNERRQLTRD